MKQQNDAVGSLAISQLLVKIFLGVLVGVDVAAYWLVEWFLSWTHYRLTADLPWQALFLLTLYAASIPAYFALYRLYRLLANLDKGQVFVEQNVTCLAVLSRCCWVVAAICLASTLYYLPYLLVMVAAAFMALILRIVQNVFRQACEMKDELDLTV